MFKPLQDFIIVEEVKISDIILTPEESRKGQHFIVKALGPGCIADSGERIPLDVSIGDKVCIAADTQGKVNVIELPDSEGKTFLLARERDVLAYERTGQ